VRDERKHGRSIPGCHVRPVLEEQPRKGGVQLLVIRRDETRFERALITTCWNVAPELYIRPSETVKLQEPVRAEDALYSALNRSAPLAFPTGFPPPPTCEGGLSDSPSSSSPRGLSRTARVLRPIVSDQPSFPRDRAESRCGSRARFGLHIPSRTRRRANLRGGRRRRIGGGRVSPPR
jgi:hypothetical protein